MTIEVLAEKGQSNREISRTLGVTEGAVRYHLRRRAEGATDGRADAQERKAEAWSGVIAAWWDTKSAGPRPPNAHELHDLLVAEHGYTGSYQSVRRYLRAKYPAPRMRTYRRVETPPGAQTQTDWGEFPRVDVGDGPEPLHAFVMTLSHSRKTAVVWSRREDELHWLSCHNGAFRRLDGVAAVNRIDNVKTAIAVGAGAWGRIHPAYESYARAVGFHIDACPPREAWAKGTRQGARHLLWVLHDRRIDVSEAVSSVLSRLDTATDDREIHDHLALLGGLGPVAADAVPALVARLDARLDARRGRMEEVIGALVAIGTAAKPALPTLDRLARDDPYEQVRKAAAAAAAALRN